MRVWMWSSHYMCYNCRFTIGLSQPIQCVCHHMAHTTNDTSSIHIAVRQLNTEHHTLRVRVYIYFCFHPPEQTTEEKYSFLYMYKTLSPLTAHSWQNAILHSIYCVSERASQWMPTVVNWKLDRIDRNAHTHTAYSDEFYYNVWHSYFIHRI